MADSWIYDAPANLVPAKPFKTGKQVKMCINNQVATTSIPNAKLNQGYEELIAFMNAHPLNGAYFNTLPHIYPSFINEWWYTCSANGTNTAITGTIDNGNRAITIDQEIIRKVLNLPTGATFEAIPTKEVARQSLSVVGYTKPKGPILMSAFTSRWKFIISSIIRSLGGKSSSTGEMNEFETQILSSFITGLNINYAELYFKELIKLVNEPARIFNVPFIRFLSLCFEHVLGESVYASFLTSIADIPVPMLTSKVFNNTITSTEVPITAAMQHWIDHPYAVESDMEGDGSGDSEGTGAQTEEGGVAAAVHTDSGNTESTQSVPPESDSHISESVTPSVEGSGNVSITLTTSSEDMNVDIPSHSDQSSPTKESHNLTTPNESPLILENSPDSETQTNIAQVESSSMEQDVIETPSSAVEHTTTTLLESVVHMSTKSTQPTLSIASLDTHIAATAQTHAVCIEEDVPILDTTHPILAPLQMTSPIFTTSPALVHIQVSHSLHPSAQIDNASVMSQTEVQISNPSIPDDQPSVHPMVSEGIPPYTSTASDTLPIPMVRLKQVDATQTILSDTLSYQRIRSERIPTTPFVAYDLYSMHKMQSEATSATQIEDLNDPSQSQPELCERQSPIIPINSPPPTQSVPSSTLNDVLLAINQLSERVQTEQNNNKKELEEMKHLVSTMVHKVDKLEEMVSSRLEEMQTTLSSLVDDVKKGEKFESAELNKGEKDNIFNNNENNNNENINDDEGEENDEGDDGDDGPEGAKVKSQTQGELQTEHAQTEEAGAQTQGEIACYDHAQTQGESSQVLYVKPLQHLTLVDQACLSVVEKIKKREREESEQSEPVLQLKRGKRVKRMAVKRPERSLFTTDMQIKEGITVAEFLRLEHDEDLDDSDATPNCSTGSEEFRDFDDDDDDDAPISSLLHKHQTDKGKSGGSKSSQTETQHQESNQSKGKDKVVEEEMKEEEVMEIDPEVLKLQEKERRQQRAREIFGYKDQPSTTDVVQQTILDAAAELGITPEEYLNQAKKNEEQLKQDMQLQARLNRQHILACRLREDYSYQRIPQSLIMSCNVYREKGRIRIDYRLTSHKRLHVYVDQLFTLGFIEWKYIARFIKDFSDKSLREDVMSEIILLVEAAHDLEKLSDKDYRNFCISFNIKVDNRPVGLAVEDLNNRYRPMPEGLNFVDNTYVQTKNYDGFMYKDPNGVHCFQPVDSLHNTEYYHLFGLLDLCKDKQNQLFRKKVVRCLFYHLGEIEKDHEFKSKCDRVRKEHRKNEKDNLAEVELVERMRRQKHG